MKSAALIVFALTSAAFALPAGHSSPVTRVVELLQDLAKRIEEEGKYEEDLYESYVCWANKVLSEKSTSNEKAESRIDYLKSYLHDVESGKIDFTSESGDLETEIRATTAGIEKAEANRKKDHDDARAAAEELELAIKALEKALGVIGQSTSQGQSLVAMKFTTEASFSQRLEDAAALERAIRYGKLVLSAADAHFLEKVLSSDVPKKDWKKLNRKATFKAKYQSRSGKIFDVLSKLLKTFHKNLAEIHEKEEEAAAFFEKLMKSKHTTLDELKAAHDESAVEGAARDVVIEDTKAEIKDLEEQLEADHKIIEETHKSLDEKHAEFKARKHARAKELAAISKAISILYSDDARDLFKKSYRSQTLQLLQVDVASSVAIQAQRRAGSVLRATAKEGRVLLLAIRLQAALATTGPFDEVIKAIDNMMTKLEEETKEDQKKVDDCTKTLKDDTRAAKDASHDIDGLTDDVAKLESEIKALVAEIKEKKETIKEIGVALEEAKKQRDLEHADWVQNDKDDSAALLLVKHAKEVLAEEYGAVFFQLRDPDDYRMGEVKVGEAPPPPPKTWDGDYETKKEDGGNIVSMLGVIADEIEADLKKAKEAEDKAQKDFDDFVSESDKEIQNLDKDIDDLRDQQTKKNEKIAENKEAKGSKKGGLEALIKKMKDAEPTCNFYAMHIKTRKQNRELEAKGLKEAKKILEKAKLQKAG